MKPELFILLLFEGYMKRYKLFINGPSITKQQMALLHIFIPDRAHQSNVESLHG